MITISREYGSGGRAIGKNIAKALNVPYYDTELIHMFAEKSGYTEDFIKNNEEQMSKFQFNLYSWYTPSISERDISQVERLFHIEEKMINEIASKSSCVIVGRLANLILGDRDNTFHIFISSDADAKIRRIMGRDELSSEDAQKKALKVDRERATHCRYFVHREWGKANNYDITIKSSRYGIERTSNILIDMIRKDAAI